MPDRDSGRSPSDTSGRNVGAVDDHSGPGGVHAWLFKLKQGGVLAPGDQITANYKRDVFIAEVDSAGFLVVLGAREASTGTDNSTEYQDLIGVRFGSPDSFMEAMMNIYLSRRRGRRGREGLDGWESCVAQRQQKSLGELYRELEQLVNASSDQSLEGGRGKLEGSSVKRMTPGSRGSSRKRIQRKSNEPSTSSDEASAVHQSLSLAKRKSQVSRASEESPSQSESSQEQQTNELRLERRSTRAGSHDDATVSTSSGPRHDGKSSELHIEAHPRKYQAQQGGVEKKFPEKLPRRSSGVAAHRKDTAEPHPRGSSDSSPEELTESERTQKAIRDQHKVHPAEANNSSFSTAQWESLNLEQIARRMLEMLTLKPKALFDDADPESLMRLQELSEHVKAKLQSLSAHARAEEPILASFAAGYLKGIGEGRSAIAHVATKAVTSGSFEADGESENLSRIKGPQGTALAPSARSTEADTTIESDDTERPTEARTSESEKGSKRRKVEWDGLRTKLEAEMMARQELELERRNLLVSLSDSQKFLVREAKRRRLLESELSAERMQSSELRGRIDRIHLRLSHLLGIDNENFLRIDGDERVDHSVQSAENAEKLSENHPQTVDEEEQIVSERGSQFTTPGEFSRRAEDQPSHPTGSQFSLSENQVLKARLRRIERELREWKAMLVSERCVRAILVDAKSRLESDIGDLRIISEKVQERKRPHKESSQKKSKKKASSKGHAQTLAPSQHMGQSLSMLPNVPVIYGNEISAYDRMAGFVPPSMPETVPGFSAYSPVYYYPSLPQRNGLPGEMPLIMSAQNMWPPQEVVQHQYGIAQPFVHLDAAQLPGHGVEANFPSGVEQETRYGYMTENYPNFDGTFRGGVPGTIPSMVNQVFARDPPPFDYRNAQGSR
jgi:hypothetical protein